MEFKKEDHIVLTDEFKKISGNYLKYPKHMNAVFIIIDIVGQYYILSIDGINKIGGWYRKENFRLATKNEIKSSAIKKIFIN